MTRRLRNPAARLLSVSLACGAVVALAAACGRKRPQVPRRPQAPAVQPPAVQPPAAEAVIPPGRLVRPTPAPPWRGVGVGGVSRTQVLAYAAGLQFDTLRSARATQLLFRRNGVVPNGPPGYLEREIGSEELTMEQLRQGRIIARLVSRGGLLPVFGATSDTSYLWVDGTESRMRAVIITTDPAAGDSLITAARRPFALRLDPPTGADDGGPGSQLMVSADSARLCVPCATAHCVVRSDAPLAEAPAGAPR